MRQAARWLVLFEGTEGSPIERLECEFTCSRGFEEEYVRKIERALDPAICIMAGPLPLNLDAYSETEGDQHDAGADG